MVPYGSPTDMSLDWFTGKNWTRKPPYSMVKIMVSGEDFPEKTSPTNMRSKTRSKIGAFPGQHSYR